jgi:hypothetical protein
MADLLSVIFDRWDRHPNMHEYGKAIDHRLDRLAGGSDQIRRGGPDPRVPIRGFAAKLELHETGPIFLLDPSDLPALAPLLDDVRAMARDWANRSTGGEQKMLRVKIRSIGSAPAMSWSAGCSSPCGRCCSPCRCSGHRLRRNSVQPGNRRL